MMDVFEKKLASEKKKAQIFAWIIDSLLLYYFFFAAYYFYLTLMAEPGANTYPTSSNLIWMCAPSLALSFLWAQTGLSAGTWVVYSTNHILKNQKRSLRTQPALYTIQRLFFLVLLILTFILGVQLTESSFTALFSSEGIQGAKNIFLSLMNPNWKIIGMVSVAMVQTIFIAFMATALAVPIAFIFSFFSARNLVKGSVVGGSIYSVLRIISNFTRSVEPIIWAIIFSVWVGIGPFAGMLALMLHSVASLIKQYSEQIECIEKGPVEAIEATGANKIQVVWFAVVPQVILPFLSFTIFRWDINIRMATIIGLVGGGGVGTLLMQYQGLAKWNEVGTIVIVIALVVWVMDYLSARIREAIL